MTRRALPVVCPKCGQDVPRYRTRGDRYRTKVLVESRRYYRCACGHRFATTVECVRLPSGALVTTEEPFPAYRPTKPRTK